MTQPIAIKGSKDGLRLLLAEDADWDDLLDALRRQLERGAEFFHGAHLTIDTGERPISDDDLADLLEIMQAHGLQPAQLATNTPEGRNAGRSTGLMTRPSVRPSPQQPERDGDGALLVTRTLRSGQVLRHHGHITIIGDVNPGAEVIAGGNIIVWGRLRGRVHAGALGDTAATVGALELMPSLIQIADKMSRPPDQRPQGPETARIEGDMIHVELWEGSKR
jgi:septum site-determining protein MinC